jgi:hypothetical protein
LEKEQLFLLAEPGGDSRGVVVVGVRAVFESDLRWCQSCNGSGGGCAAGTCGVGCGERRTLGLVSLVGCGDKGLRKGQKEVVGDGCEGSAGGVTRAWVDSGAAAEVENVSGAGERGCHAEIVAVGDRVTVSIIEGVRVYVRNGGEELAKGGSGAERFVDSCAGSHGDNASVEGGDLGEIETGEVGLQKGRSEVESLGFVAGGVGDGGERKER